MKLTTDIEQIDEILNRGVVSDILPDKDAFRKLLTSGKKLRFYIGADPTSSKLHLSHAKNYLLLEEFRRLGHEVIVLFGDFTARIGDPSDRSAARSQLSSEEVAANVSQWLEQIAPLMDFDSVDNPPQVKYNSEWLSSLTFEELIDLASNFTVQQMIERDMFQRRLKQEQPIYMHEFFYPLMQGYDSVAMEVDVELCGTDQIFNAMAGRTLSKRLTNKDKYVVAVNLMENPVTGELMSKSNGTGVFLGGSALDTYGAIMAQPDEMINALLINNTRVPLEDINQIVKLPPREAKARAALEVTKVLYESSQAKAAQDAWEKQFTHGELPQDIPDVAVRGYEWLVSDLAVEVGLAGSKAEARRLLQQNGFKLNGNKITSDEVVIANDDVLQAGKRRFVRLMVS